MMRTYHDHEDDEYLDVRSDMHHNNVFHGYNNGPDPRYYRNAPRSDEGHINTSSDECKTSCSMSRRSPDHSPKCNAAVGTTTVVHDNERDCFEDERDAPEEEDFDYREDEYYTTDEQESHWQGSYLTHHNHPVPAFGNGEGTHVFVPVDGSPHGYYHHDSHHPDGHYYHHQSRFPDPRYDIYHQHHVYGHHQQQHPSHPQPPPEYASAPFRHEEHVNDPGYYTNAFDAPLPEQVQNAPPPPPQENVDPPAGATREYGECDVLCGRGALMIWHPGNQYFRSLVQKYRQRYFFSRRQEKKKIASQIIDGVREAGGRFLRRSQASDGLNEINVWVEIDEERAYQKCCQALREGAPEIRRQWRNKPDARGKSKADESKENDDNAASR